MNEMIAGSGPVSETDLATIEATGKRFVIANQIAEAMCLASILPEHLRTKRKDGKTVPLEPSEIKANCVLIANQALKWGTDPVAIMGETYVVGGKLAFQGKLVAAIVNKLGGLSKRLSYEFSGEGNKMAVTVSGQLIGEDEPRQVSLKLSDAKTDNAMWNKDPQQKLCYSGAVRWARRHCPEVLLGIIAEDEPIVTLDASAVPLANLGSPDESGTPKGRVGDDEPSKIDIVDVIKSYKQRIDEADSEDALSKLAERIDAELVLPEQAREDLKSIARERFGQLRNSSVPVTA